MVKKNGRRYIDRSDMLVHIPHFIKRQHGIKLQWFIPVFLSIIIVLWYSVFNLYNEYIIISVTSIPVVIAFIFSISWIKYTRDIIMATEFQNALFSNAARVDAEYSLIIKKDGTIIYSDAKFNDNFCSVLDEKYNNISILLNNNYFNNEEKSKILNALDNFSTISVPFIYKQQEHNHTQEKALTLTVQPLKFAKEKFYNMSVSNLERHNEFFFIKIGKDSHFSDIKSSLNLLDMGYILLNKDGDIIDANDCFYKKTKLSAKDLPFNLVNILSNENLPFNDGNIRFKIKDQNINAIIKYNNVTENKNVEYQNAIIYFLEENIKINLDNIGVCWNTIIYNAPIAVALIDGNGIINRSNIALEEFLINNSINGKRFSNFLTNESAKEFNNIVASINKNTNKLDQFSLNIDINDDDHSSGTVYLSKITNTENSHEKIIMYLFNMTEQRNLEQRFAHSQKMQAVGQLAGGIAHDFNNLLTAMIGFSDLLLSRHKAGDPSFADIMQIKQNANRAANLVRQLLAFSRKQTLRPEILDITDIISELSNLMKRLIGEKIELNINHDRDIGLVKVDQGQLEQVLINLAVNARDAMKEGGLLTINTSNVIIDSKHSIKSGLFAPESDDKIIDGDYVLIEFKDTGCGIGKKMLPKIFEPFFSTKELGSGTGLGLSTVYGIIKQTGGYIYVSSKENVGTIFYIYLKKYDKSDNMQEIEILSQKNQEKQEMDLTGQGIILLVEDESSVRNFTAHALNNKGYEVLEADCGEAALEIVKEKGNKIDLIITDVIMPGINGTVLVEEVLKDYPDVKVIFISGYTDDEFVKAFGETSQLHFIPKPFTLKQLAVKVKEVLNS